MKPRVLLFNPPGSQLYLRDGYCSQVAKGPYLWPPMDLLIQQAKLQPYADVRFIDAIAHPQPVNAADYEVIVFLSSWISLQEDLQVAESLKQQNPDVFLIAMGDLFRFYPKDFLAAFPVFDEALSDYASSALIEHLQGQSPDWHCLNNDFDYGTPNYSHYDPTHYRLPIPGFHHLGMVLTSDGCPFKCNYCNLSPSPLRSRNIESVEEEIRALGQHGVFSILLKDPTLNYHPKKFQVLLKSLIRLKAEDSRYRFCAFLRGDTLSSAQIQQMAKAGICAVMLGVESGRSQLLKEDYERSFQHERLQRAIAEMRHVGVLSIGLFIIGLDDFGSEAEGLENMQFFDTDLVSANHLIIRPGTPLFEKLLQEQGWTSLEAWKHLKGDFPLRDGTPSQQLRLQTPTRLFQRYHSHPKRIFRVAKWAFTHQALGDFIQLGLRFQSQTKT